MAFETRERTDRHTEADRNSSLTYRGRGEVANVLQSRISRHLTDEARDDVRYSQRVVNNDVRSSEFETWFQREVPLFLEIPKFHSNSVDKPR